MQRFELLETALWTPAGGLLLWEVILVASASKTRQPTAAMPNSRVLIVVLTLKSVLEAAYSVPYAHMRPCISALGCRIGV